LAGLVQRRREFTAGRERLLCGTHFYRLTDWSWPAADELSRTAALDRGCVKTIDGLISRMEGAKKSRCGSILFTFLG
jgi:hypothetical protein